MRRKAPLGDIRRLTTSQNNTINIFMKILKYKYRIYPSKQQQQMLWIACCHNRFVWNYFLKKEQEQYEATKKFNFFEQNCKDLTALKQTYQWLKEVPSTSLQQTLRYLDRALKQSFKKNGNAKKGFPKVKKKRNFQSSFSLAMVHSEANLKGNKFKCPKFGLMPIKLHRAMPSDFKTCQVKQESGKWYVAFTCEKQEKPKTAINLMKSIGIDLNSKEYVCSDGKCHQIPKYLRENQTKIKRYQRAVARKKKGSSNRRKAILKLAKSMDRIKRKRFDYFHKLSTSLVHDYDLICLEDLDVKGIQQKYGSLIQDNGFSLFREMILYKSELYGKETVKINRWYPSSQTCSGCGHLQKMPVGVEIYKCSGCGIEIDRDLNAAINIVRAGTAQSACGKSELMMETAMYSKLAGIVEAGSPRL